jgi:putative membrane protein
MKPESHSPLDAGDPRVYFAAERTLLAWVRTGLAMMGFGFVVARFGLFLRELAAAGKASPHPQQSVSLWVGTVLIMLGVTVFLCAAVRHWHTVLRLKRNQPLRFHALSLGVAVAIVLVLLGMLLAAYLVLGFRRAPPHFICNREVSAQNLSGRSVAVALPRSLVQFFEDAA